MPLLTDDQHAAAGLRRMKTLSTSLLVLAAVVYVVSLQFGGSFDGFVRAGSEAAMVGGFADWFAVTALFRRPLGLPIPHTGLIPRKKDDLATKLGEFVTGHFLTREVVVEQVAQADVIGRLGSWLVEPDVTERVARELAFNGSALLGALDEEAVVASALDLLRRDQARRSYAPVLGRVLERAVEGGTQRPLIDIVVGRAKRYLRANIDTLLPQARRFVDERGWFASLFVSDKRIRIILESAADLLEEIERNPQHWVRLRLEDLLRDIADDLQHDPRTAEKLDTVILQLLDDVQAQAALADVVTDALASVRASLADADGELHARLVGLVQSMSKKLVADDAFRDRLEKGLEAVVGHAVDNYGSELTSLIRKQVARWDATSASQRIELAVGRDLQFIRINGTAVGALAGLTIHTLTVAFS